MKKRVLIVDDEAANRYFLQCLLEGKGLAVEAAENGDVALKKVRANPPDLIVSDILMPVMDGYALCRKCKLAERLKNIPFVFYTATYTDPEDEKFALSLGADRFLLKPQDPERLLGILMECLETKPARLRRKPLGEEMEYFRGYNQVLFRKLEKKMADLETASENLGALKERYRLSFEYASDVIFTIDENLKLASMSPSIERILGLKPGDFVGREVIELAHVFTPDSFRRMLADTGRILRGETMAGVEYECLAADGTPKTVEFSGSPIIQEGKTVGLISVARDITARKKAEDELRESEKKYHDLFEFLPIPVYEMDLEGNITAANRAIYETFKGSEEDVKKGFNAFRLLSPDQVEKARSNIQRLIRGEQIEGTEYTFRKLDGASFPAIVVSNVIYADGRPTRLRGAIIDITERREAEEKLRRTNAFLDSIVEHIPDMIFIKDARDLRFVRLNRAGVDLIGRPREEMLGKNDHDFFPKDQADRFTEKDREVLRGKTAVDIPVEPMNTRSRGARILHTKKVPILNANGDPEYLMGISEDVTDRIAIEEALRKSEARFRRYFELPLVGMAISSPDKGWLEVNDCLLDILGYTRPELIQKTWDEITHPDDLSANMEQFNRVLDGAVDGYSMDKRFIRKDGRTVWTSMAVGCVRRPDGSVEYFATLVQDITLRKESQERLGKTLKAVVQAMAVTVETRDPYTAGHQRRVADLAQAIGVEMGLPPDSVDGLRLAATIHDLGKISVPAEILSKPTKLTNTEFRLIQTHPQAGYEILKDIEFPWPIARMILEHHERIDGTGYPNKLTGDRLLPESRILMVADVVEAMASNRPYRPSLGLAPALAEIALQRGIAYDADVVDACLRLFNEKNYRFAE